MHARRARRARNACYASRDATYRSLSYALLIHLHLLRQTGLAVPNVLHRDVFADLLLADDLLIENRRGASRKLVIPHLLLAHVGGDVVPQQLRLLLCDNAHVDVASRAQIVEDTSLNSFAGQLDRLVPRQIRLPQRLEHTHGRQTTGTHRDVGELVGGAVGVDGEEVTASGVAASDDEVGADVALIAEEVLLEHGHDGDDARLAAGGEGMQLEVGRDEGGGELGVGGGSRAGAPDLGSDIV